MNDIRTLIVTGGRIDKDFALAFLHDRKMLYGKEYDNIIAVDGGLSVLRELSIMPTDIVGDFDTVEPEVLAYYEKKNGIRIRRFNPHKDDTDSEIAVHMAIEYKSTCTDILGASGSRLDHTIGNIRLLGTFLQAGREAFLYDKNNRVRLIGQSCTIKRSEAYGNYISLLPFTQEVRGITLEGFQYPLVNHTMDIFQSPTLGISNEIIEEEGRVSLQKGVLLLIESKD